MLEHCQADVGSIENEISDVQERWDAVCSVIHDVKEKIPKMKEAVPEYEEKAKPLEQSLEEANNLLTELEPFGLDTTKGNEQLNKLKVRLFHRNVCLNSQLHLNFLCKFVWSKTINFIL